jgi:hypothetical protein
MPPKGKKSVPVKPPAVAPTLVKTSGAFSLNTADDDVKLAVFEVIKNGKGLDAPRGKNAAIASAIILRLYGKGGVLVEYEQPTKETAWLSRCKAFFTAEYDALQMKTHGGDDEEEDETEFEKFLNKTFPKTKMGKQRKKSAETKKDNETVDNVLGKKKKRVEEVEVEEVEEEEEEEEVEELFTFSNSDRNKVIVSSGKNSKTKERKSKMAKRKVVDDEEQGRGRKKKGKNQKLSDGLSLPGGGADSSLLNMLQKLVNNTASSSSSSAAVAVPPTPAASGEDNEKKLARYRAEQAALLADIRVESDDAIKAVLKVQFTFLSTRIAALAAL